MLIVTSFIQLNGERGRKLIILGFVLGEILEMENMTDGVVNETLELGTQMNLLKRLCYSIVNSIIQHILGEHVNTITTK